MTTTPPPSFPTTQALAPAAASALETAPPGASARIPAGRYEIAGGFAVELAAPAIAVKTSTATEPARQTWHVVDGGADDVWTTTALAEAGAVLVPVPQMAAPEPAAETPADDSPAALQVAALAVMGDLIRALPTDAAIGLAVDRHGELEATARLWPGIGGCDLDGFGRNRLATFQALHRLTGAQLTASPRAGRELHIKGVGTWRGVAITIRGLTDEGEPATIAAARAWLAELGVEVKA